jgi:Nitrile hydratase, alpha chain
MERRLVQRSLEDEDFRQRLLDDPTAAVEQELGSPLPEGVEVRVVEESPQTIYLVLPSASAVGEGGELSDEELEAVAGGALGNKSAYQLAATADSLVGLGPEVEGSCRRMIGALQSHGVCYRQACS